MHRFKIKVVYVAWLVAFGADRAKRNRVQLSVRMLRLLSITMLLCLGLLGCGRVQPTDVTGTWAMKESSRQILPVELQKNSAKIVLSANGTFVASDLPGIFDFPPEPARLDGGSGVWKLVSREGKQQVQFDFEMISSGKIKNLPFGMQMDVSDGWTAVSLYYFLGDPDEGLRVAFEKK
jgi:hypothetical protein